MYKRMTKKPSPQGENENKRENCSYPDQMETVQVQYLDPHFASSFSKVQRSSPE